MQFMKFLNSQILVFSTTPFQTTALSTHHDDPDTDPDTVNEITDDPNNTESN